MDQHFQLLGPLETIRIALDYVGFGEWWRPSGKTTVCMEICELIAKKGFQLPRSSRNLKNCLGLCMVWRRLAQKSKIPHFCINSMKLPKNHENSVKSVNFGTSEPTCSKPYIIPSNSNGFESSVGSLVPQISLKL